MSRREIAFGRTALLIALAVVMGCGGGASSDADSDTAAVAEQEAAPPAANGAAAARTAAQESGPIMLTADDLDRYRKGRLAEIEDVKKKAAALSAAKNGTDSLDALAALTDEAQRTAAGASAAGMDVAAYSRLTSAVDHVLGAWETSEMMRKMQGDVDTTGLDAEQRARVRDNIASAQAGLKNLPEANVKLILPRAPELDSLRMLPAALALKAAGA